MKKIVVIRGGQEKPLIKEKDTFDSVVMLYNDTHDLRCSNVFFNFNSDFYNGYAGGIIAEGRYGGIVFDRPNGKRAVKLFQEFYLDVVTDEKEITENMRSFNSLIPNPNHANRKIITQVLIHEDGLNGGYSQGCITGYRPDFLQFISYFQLKEKMLIEIIRQPGWKAPAFYQGN